MTNAGRGYLRRLVRRSTSDVAELDAEDLAERSQAGGAQRVREAELFDGTDGSTLVRPGRRGIIGVDTGRTVKARGRIADREGREVLHNPDYELQNTA